jgi:hypothetical protein
VAHGSGWARATIGLGAAAALLLPCAGTAARPVTQTYPINSPRTNLLYDAGFESPVVPVGGFSLFGSGQGFSKWQVVGTGNVAICSTTFASDGFTFPAKSGGQWLDLTGTTQSRAGVQQTVATAPGQLYALTFWVGNIYDPGGPYGTTSTVRVYVNGSLALTVRNSRGTGTTTMAWQRFRTTFSATSTETTLAFINADPRNDSSNGLDDVRLVPATLADLLGERVDD